MKLTLDSFRICSGSTQKILGYIDYIYIYITCQWLLQVHGFKMQVNQAKSLLEKSKIILRAQDWVQYQTISNDCEHRMRWDEKRNSTQLKDIKHLSCNAWTSSSKEWQHLLTWCQFTLLQTVIAMDITYSACQLSCSFIPQSFFWIKSSRSEKTWVLGQVGENKITQMITQQVDGFHTHTNTHCKVTKGTMHSQ